LEVEFIQRKNFRKEDRVAEVLARRGDQSRTRACVLGPGALSGVPALA
jgi:hypothetical protein